MSEQLLMPQKTQECSEFYWKPAPIRRLQGGAVRSSNLFYDFGGHKNQVYYIPQFEIRRKKDLLETETVFISAGAVRERVELKTKQSVAIYSANAAIVLSIFGLIILLFTTFIPLLAAGLLCAIVFSWCSKKFFSGL